MFRGVDDIQWKYSWIIVGADRFSSRHLNDIEQEHDASVLYASVNKMFFFFFFTEA